VDAAFDIDQGGPGGAPAEDLRLALAHAPRLNGDRRKIATFRRARTMISTSMSSAGCYTLSSPISVSSR
jgi:hypothetical protein